MGSTDAKQRGFALRLLNKGLICNPHVNGSDLFKIILNKGITKVLDRLMQLTQT
jgi:hypothetical protein